MLVGPFWLIICGPCAQMLYVMLFAHRRSQGLHFLMPFADYARVVRWRTTETHLSGNKQVVSFTASRVRRIDLREQVFDFVAQPIITRDNVEIYVHPMLLFQLVDPIKVCYATADLTSCVEKLVTTTLRSIIGAMAPHQQPLSCPPTRPCAASF